MESINWPSTLMVMGPIAGFLLGIWISNLMRIRWVVGVILSIGINLFLGTLMAVIAERGLSGEQSSLRFFLHRRLNSNDAEAPVTAVSVLIAANIFVALVVKLYRAIVLQKASPAEMQTGAAQFRAWLSPINVISVVVLAICCSFGLDYNYIGVAILGFMLLLIYPLIGALPVNSSTETKMPQAPADERQRVLALVEAGKISAEDAAELLSALAQSQSAGSGVASIGPARRIILAGAAIILVGFFLPWFTLNVQKAMETAINSVQQTMPHFDTSNFPGSVNMSGNNLPLQTPSVPVNVATQWDVHGGDVQNGLGWITLLLALGSASLPFFWTQRPGNSHQQRNASIIAIGAGSVALMYLLTNSLNPVTTIQPGFFIVLCGYVVMWVGVVREYGVRTADIPIGLSTTA
jgi:hypothetical protein